MKYSKKSISNNNLYKYLLEINVNYFDYLKLKKSKLRIDKIVEKFRTTDARVEPDKPNNSIKTIYEYKSGRETGSIKNINFIDHNGDIRILLYIKNIPKDENKFVKSKISFVIKMISSTDETIQKEKNKVRKSFVNIKSLFKILRNETAVNIFLFIHNNKEAKFTELETNLKKNPNSINYALKGLLEEGLVEEKKRLYHMTSKGNEIFNILTRLENTLQ